MSPQTLVISAAFAALYLAYPSQDYYFDGLVFAGAIERVSEGGPAALLFHPHHLLYCPAVFLGYSALLSTGFVVRAWFFQQLVSAACGLGVLYLFRRLLRRLGVGSGLADAGTVTLGSSYVTWHFATQGDTTLPATLLQLLVLSSLAAESDRPRSLWATARIGALTGTAFLIHQAAAVLVPSCLWLIWQTGPATKRWTRAVAFLAVSGVTVGAGYLGAMILGLHLARPAAMLDWLRGYVGFDPLTGTVQHYGRWSLASLELTARAMTEAFVGLAADGRPARLIVAGIGLLGFALVAGHGLVTGWRRRTAGRRTFIQAVSLALLCHAVFFTFWSAGHARYWAMMLPAWLVIVFLGFAERNPPVLPWWKRGEGLGWLAAGAVVLTVGGGPFRREIDPAINSLLGVANSVEAATPPESLVIIAGTGEFNALKAYIPYFARRRLMVLDWRFANPAIPPARAITRLRTYLAEVLQDRPVYAVSDVLSPAVDEAFLVGHGVTPGMRHDLFAPFRPRSVATLIPGLTLLGLSAR